MISDEKFYHNFINKIFNNEYLFFDQKITRTNYLEYTEGMNEYNELSADNKNKLLQLFINIDNNINNIQNLVNNKPNFLKLFDYTSETSYFINPFYKIKDLLIEKISLFIDTYEKYSLSNISFDNTVIIVDSNGQKTIKNNVYKIDRDYYHIIRIFGEKNNELIKMYSAIDSFDIDEILKYAGYESIEEVKIYYKKFLEIINNKNNLINTIMTKRPSKVLKFFHDVRLVDYPGFRDLYDSMMYKDSFFKIKKNIIDNFNIIIDKNTIKLESNLVEPITITLNPMRDNPYEDLSSPNSHVTSAEKPLLEWIDYATRKYYKSNLDSYNYGILSSYYNSIILEKVENLIAKSFDEYTRIYNVYNLKDFFIEKKEKDDCRSLFYNEIINNNSSNPRQTHVISSDLIPKLVEKKPIKIENSILDNLSFSILEKIEDLIKNGTKEINLDDLIILADKNEKESSYVSTSIESIIKENDNLFKSITYTVVSNMIFENHDLINPSFDNALKESNNDNLNDLIIRYILLSNKSSEFSSVVRSDKFYSHKDLLDHRARGFDLHLGDFINYTPRAHPYLKSIHRDDLDSFFKILIKIETKQLNQEDSFMRGSSNSLGIIDEIKKNNQKIRSIKPNNNIDLNEFLRSLSTSLIPIGFGLDLSGSRFLRSFFKYFFFFPDEAESFFKERNLNKVKNNIIKIINFLNNEDILEKFNYTEDGNEYNFSKNKNGLIVYEPSRNYDDPYYDSFDIEPQEKQDNTYGLSCFLDEKFKNIDLGTKKEKLDKLNNISVIFHNNKNSTIYLNALINSKYFTVLFRKNILEILSIIESVKSNYSDLINQAKYINSKSKKLITDEMISDPFILESLKLLNQPLSTDTIDSIIEYILSGEYSENTRRLKYITSTIVQYSQTEKWFNLAKEKEKDVFSANFSTESFRFRVLEDFDPYHFRVGVDTNCCQMIGGQGESAAVDSFINPKAGVVVLEANNGGNWNLAAQSYFHVFSMNKDGKEIKGIILDNIEAGKLHSRYGKDYFYPKAYAILGRYLKNKGFDIVGCGEKYTEVIKNMFEKTSIASDPRHFEVEEHDLSRYTDFNHRSFYDLLKPKFNFEMPNDIDSEFKMAKYNNVLLKLSKFLINIKLEKESIKVYNLIY